MTRCYVHNTPLTLSESERFTFLQCPNGCWIAIEEKKRVPKQDGAQKVAETTCAPNVPFFSPVVAGAEKNVNTKAAAIKRRKSLKIEEIRA